MRSRRPVALLMAGLVVLGCGVACGDDAPVSDGPVIRGVPGDADLAAAQIEGRLRRVGDCLLVGRVVAVWPAAAEWDGGSVEIGGDRYDVGTEVRLGGGLYESGGWQDVVVDAARAPLEACLEAAGSTAVALVG